MKKIAILGSTGSIGSSLLNIIKKDKEKFKIELISANKNYRKIIKQAKFFNVKKLIITDKNSFLRAKIILKDSNFDIYNDFNSFKKIFSNKKLDYAMSAITGFEGLKPTLKIIKFTKVIAIANKESIICGWNLIKKNLKKFKTEFIPVDSEHFSIWSLVNNIKNKDIEKVFLTASGGPFNNYPLKKFKNINIAQALKHPNWKMGKKITIDSSTLMNKVFEIIEAKKIFNYSYDKLHILVHPKSYVHAIVKFKNGLTKVLIHDTNMKIPIFNSFYSNFEKNIKTKKLDFDVLNNLNFKKVDIIKFPVIKILKKIPNKESLFETVIVSVNDHLVNMFLEKRISFQDISKYLLKITNMSEFKKYKKLSPRNVEEIEKLNHYVSLNITALCV